MCYYKKQYTTADMDASAVLDNLSDIESEDSGMISVRRAMRAVRAVPVRMRKTRVEELTVGKKSLVCRQSIK